MDPLKELLASKKAEIKDLKAAVKKLSKQKGESGVVDKIAKTEKQINKLEGFVLRFSPRYMEPKQVDGIVINYKLYTQFMKKLKDFQITEEVKAGNLVITYYRGIHKGELVLHDLTHIFPEGSKFPEGKPHGQK